MTRGVTSREQRRREAQPLPADLRAELRSRVTEAAVRRDQTVAEARRQKKVALQAAEESFQAIRESAQRAFEAERDAIRAEVEQRAGLA